MQKRDSPFKKKTINLSEEAIEKLKEGCKFSGLNESNFVEFLIMQQAESIDPILKLQNINKRIKELRTELIFEEEKSQKLTEDFAKHQKWLKEKQSKKPQALRIITTLISRKEYVEAERKAKVWSRILGVSPVTLLVESMESSKRYADS